MPNHNYKQVHIICDTPAEIAAIKAAFQGDMELVI